MNFDFMQVDWEDPLYWPQWTKTIAMIVTIVVLLTVGYLLLIQEKQSQLKQLEKIELQLKQQFELKQAKASNLDEYRLQMEEIRISLDTMLAQLPKKNEVAGLLTDISQTGLANGLEFELFKPSLAKPIEFYAELPITMKVTGSYHQLGYFVSDIAALSRIVTFHDFAIQPQIQSNKMVIELTAKTYRYLSEE
ncbi:MAG TPA: pilus assembly protein PilO [Gammaproteobacteria bacterium]|nr:pilus assembly protein PilO [Gammaproteobacteria bacterium]HAU06430.1 pilus assembly protein PilO [Gammaproteobacteria bacterium]